jgi:hypothetical protein
VAHGAPISDFALEVGKMSARCGEIRQSFDPQRPVESLGGFRYARHFRGQVLRAL